MVPGDPGPALYEGYWAEVGKGLQGYFIDGPVNMIVGAGSAVAHPITTLQGIGSAIAHPIVTAQAVGEAVGEAVAAKADSGTRGQSEIAFNVATDVLAPEAAAEVTVPTAALAKVEVLAQTTRGVVSVGTKTVVVVGSKTATVTGGGIASSAVLGGIGVVQMAAGGSGPGDGGAAPNGGVNPGNLKVLGKGRPAQLGFDAEAFKADIVGAKGGAKFNIAVGPNGEVYLVPVHAGSTPPVPTGHTIEELPNLYPIGGD